MEQPPPRDEFRADGRLEIVRSIMRGSAEGGATRQAMAAVASACYRLAEAPQVVPDMSSEVADRVAAVIPVVAEECDAMIGQRVARLSGSAKQRRNRALHDFQQPFGGKQTAVRFFERSCGGAADQASGSPGKCAPHHAHVEMQELALQDLAYRRSETREYNEDVNSVDMGHGFTDHVEDHCLRFELQVAAEIAEVARLAEERFVALAGRLESLGAAGPQSRRRVASQVEESRHDFSIGSDDSENQDGAAGEDVDGATLRDELREVSGALEGRIQQLEERLEDDYNDLRGLMDGLMPKPGDCQLSDVLRAVQDGSSEQNALADAFMKRLSAVETSTASMDSQLRAFEHGFQAVDSQLREFEQGFQDMQKDVDDVVLRAASVTPPPDSRIFADAKAAKAALDKLTQRLSAGEAHAASVQRRLSDLEPQVRAGERALHELRRAVEQLCVADALFPRPDREGGSESA